MKSKTQLDERIRSLAKESMTWAERRELEVLKEWLKFIEEKIETEIRIAWKNNYSTIKKESTNLLGENNE